MLIKDLITKLIAREAKPGVMSLQGQAAEVRMTKAMGAYFRLVGGALRTRLSKLGDMKDVTLARHEAEVTAKQIVRRHQHLLGTVLSSHYADAMLRADKQAAFHEASSKATTTDKIGLSAKQAAEFARIEAAAQVAGIDETTIERYADAVAQAIEDQIGSAGLSRLLRDLTADMSKVRADIIARTEIADAFGKSALEKLNREEIEYKQLIPSPAACEICLSIVANGPVPTEEPFVDDDGEEYDHSPIHPNCRCATVGARGPQGE